MVGFEAPATRFKSILYVLDLMGVAVFSASGALAAMAANMDLLGILVLAAVTAIGGGTIRDVLLNRHPVFWIKDSMPLFFIIGATAVTVAWVQLLPVPRDALLIADALGLALFAIVGAQVAEQKGCSTLVIIFMGTLTGAGGGVVRDVLTDQVPLIFRTDIYATAAIMGIAVYLLANRFFKPGVSATIIGLVTVAAIRLLAVALGLHLPSFSIPT